MLIYGLCKSYNCHAIFDGNNQWKRELDTSTFCELSCRKPVNETETLRLERKYNENCTGYNPNSTLGVNQEAQENRQNCRNRPDTPSEQAAPRGQYGQLRLPKRHSFICYDNIATAELYRYLVNQQMGPELQDQRTFCGTINPYPKLYELPEPKITDKTGSVLPQICCPINGYIWKTGAIAYYPNPEPLRKYRRLSGDLETCEDTTTVI